MPKGASVKVTKRPLRECSWAARTAESGRLSPNQTDTNWRGSFHSRGAMRKTRRIRVEKVAKAAVITITQTGPNKSCLGALLIISGPGGQ